MLGKIKLGLKKAFVPPDEKSAYAPPEGVQRPKVFFEVASGDTHFGRITMGEWTSGCLW